MSSDNPSGQRRAWRTGEEWSRLRERITDGDAATPRKSPGWRTPWIAAAAAVVVVASGLAGRFSKEPAPAARVVTTGVGERLAIQLTDSSVVTLGPVSTIRYMLTPTAREMHLDGVADFKVVHDSTRPFIVRAKNAVATDLGTEFVVRAYAADSTVEVSVTSGLVSLRGTSSNALELRAGDVGRVGGNGAPVPTPRISVQTQTAWIDGRLWFDDASLASVAAELSRWFDAEIRVPDAELARRRVTAFHNRPSLTGVLDALTVSHGVRYEHSGRLITIFPGTR